MELSGGLMFEWAIVSRIYCTILLHRLDQPRTLNVCLLVVLIVAFEYSLGKEATCLEHTEVISIHIQK